MLTIDLIEAVPSPLPAEQFQRHLEEVVAKLGVQDITVELLLTDDTQIQALNRQQRGIDAPTDVLSLPTAIDSEQGSVVPTWDQPIHLGTIVISLEQAQRQLGRFGPTLEAELLGLAEHGLRHLLGYDHNEAGEWKEPDREPLH